MNDATKEKIQQVQMLEQNLQNILLQRQTFQSQFNEVTSALEELSAAQTTFKIIGNVMVKTEKEKLLSELQEKRGAMEMRIKKIEKQEETTKQKLEALQQEVVKEMQHG